MSKNTNDGFTHMATVGVKVKQKYNVM